MKALCIADLHDKVKFVLALDVLLKEKKFDLILCTGDITSGGHSMEYVLKFLDVIHSHKIPTFWVPGNNDVGEAFGTLQENLTSVENNFVEFQGEKIVGMGGIPDLYGHNIFPPKVSAKEIEDSIFLSHIPPKKIENLKKFDWQPEKFAELKLSAAPKIQISGHIHHNWGVAWIGRTKVLKMPAGLDMMAASLDTKTLEVDFIEMKKYDRVIL
ncbi:MAG: metallophosphoesterase [Candidatus Berkelbacteria bacterium]|nr:metallophosphoesterase [Candidatus Berkelbacteria bacterium]